MIHHPPAASGGLEEQVIVGNGFAGASMEFYDGVVGGRGARPKPKLFAVGAGGEFLRAQAVIDENQQVGVRAEGWRPPLFGGGFGALDRRRAVTAQLEGRVAIQVIQQHEIARVSLIFHVAVRQLPAAEAGAGVIGFAVHPVEDASIIPRHDALVRLADERLSRLGLERTARLLRLRILAKNIADAGDGVVKVALGRGEIAAAQGGQAGAVLPEDLVARRTEIDEMLAVDDRIAGQLIGRMRLRDAAGQPEGKPDREQNAGAFHRRECRGERLAISRVF